MLGEVSRALIWPPFSVPSATVGSSHHSFTGSANSVKCLPGTQHSARDGECKD